MATIIRRKRGARSRLSEYRLSELMTGQLEYPIRGYNGYGDRAGRDLAAFIDAGMIADWRMHRDNIMAVWHGEKTIEEAGFHIWPWQDLQISAEELPWALIHLDKHSG